MLAEAASGMPRPLGRSQGTWSCVKEEGDVVPLLAQRPAQVPPLGEKGYREREGGGGGRPWREGRRSSRFSWGTGAVPATSWLFWAQEDNDHRLWWEARAHLERRERTSRDIILLCPQGSWAKTGKYRR